MQEFFIKDSDKNWTLLSFEDWKRMKLTGFQGKKQSNL